MPAKRPGLCMLPEWSEEGKLPKDNYALRECIYIKELNDCKEGKLCPWNLPERLLLPLVFPVM